MIRYSFIFWILFISVDSIGQQIFEDASGESSLYLTDNNYAWFRLNTSSSSATLGFNYLQQNGFTLGKFYGIGGLDLSASVKNKLGVIFKDSKVSPDVGISGNLGFASDVLFEKDALISIFYRGELKNQKFDMASVSADTAFIDTKVRWSGKHSVNLNLFVQYGDDVESLRFLSFGFSFGYRDKYNYDDLDGVDILYPSGVNSNVYSKKTGKTGMLESLASCPLRIDIGYLPRIMKQNSLGFNLYFTAETFTSQQVVNLGIGTFFTKKDAPQSVIGGISWQFTDLSNAKGSDNSLGERSIALMYIGYVLNQQ